MVYGGVGTYISEAPNYIVNRRKGRHLIKWGLFAVDVNYN